MRRGTAPRLALLGVVVVLAAVAGWQWQRQRAAQTGHLLRLAPSAVTRIDVRLGAGPWQHYVHRAGRWQRRHGDGAVDQGQLEALARAAAIPVLHWRAAADFQPARIGLAPPQITLVLNGHVLAFGATSAVGPQRYVKVGPRIALVPLIDTPRVKGRDDVHENLGAAPAVGAP